MTTKYPYFNDDTRYELMAAILPDENENKPDAEQIVDDLREILKLCYAYTIDAGSPKEHTASELGEAIVNYLFATWTGREGDFEQFAKEYWNPAPVKNLTPEQDCSPVALPGLEGDGD